MPLIMQDCQGLSCPVVVCDHCGQQITDARDGNYQWRMGLKDTDFGSTNGAVGLSRRPTTARGSGGERSHSSACQSTSATT